MSTVPHSPEVIVVEEEERAVCGFPIMYEQWLDMFQVTRRKQAPSASDIGEDHVNIVVTYQADSIRFWGWLQGYFDAKKLEEIEEGLNDLKNGVQKFQPPINLPQPGFRGAAVFEGRWHRCFVLGADIDEDEIEVFFCDYGNSAFVSRENFRSTMTAVWALDPQARPLKLAGYELTEQEQSPEVCVDSARLCARVVKNGSYSEAHIIEIKDIAHTEINFVPQETLVSIDSQLVGTRCVPVNKLSSQQLTDEEATTSPSSDSESYTGSKSKLKKVMDSIFDYDEDDLNIGMLCNVESTQLLYLKLGGNAMFQQLQQQLDLVLCQTPFTVLTKGQLYLHTADTGERHRVLVLQDVIKVIQGEAFLDHP